MRYPHGASRPFAVYLCLLVSYALLISLLVPSVLPRVSARSVVADSARSGQNVNGEPARAGELLIKFRAGTAETDKNAVALSHGVRRSKKLRGDSDIEKVDVPAGQTPVALALQLASEPAVEFAEPNFLIAHDQFKSPGLAGGLAAGVPSGNPSAPTLQSSLNQQMAAPGAAYLNLTNAASFQNPQNELGPTDPRFSEQWALRNTGQSGGSFGSDIGVTAAWQKTTGSQSTIIAIIDSGIDFNHPDLAQNQWSNASESINGQDDDRDGFVDDAHGWDWVANNGTGSNMIKDEQGHGTAVAGIIAARGDNDIGVSGVMWRAGLMSLRVLDNTGAGDVGDAVEAIDYAVAHGAQVINLSWGTAGNSAALKDAIDRALRRGVVVVCSAGNSGQNLDSVPYYPASFGSKDLIAVAASDNNDQLPIWSNWSPRQVTIAAPGISILTTKMGGGYGAVTGTSASAPLVSGVAALIKTMRPSLNTHSVAKAISDNARQSLSLAGKVASGGIVSASGALHGSANPSPSPSPGSNGNGQPRRSPPPPPGMTGNPNQRNDFDKPAPPVTQGAPRKDLPNLDELRNLKATEPKANARIESNLMCADCDPYNGGGGGSYYPSGDPNFSNARTLPPNETGQAGVDLNSRNFNWSLPLVSLPGRAGLDLNLSLFYNSLVWTKDGSYIKYNGDLGSPAPGFRLGFPTLQQRFTDSQSGGNSYLMVTSSGGRVEMRQVGTSSIYESQDGGYTQVDVSNTSAPVVRTSDGTRLTFMAVTINSEYRCTEIKDRNGNYISATYNSTTGHLQTITDTLGRVVSFVYDGTNNLQAIRQTWAGEAHDWATFYYDQVYVAPAFGGGLLVNGPNNNYVTVLKEVTLGDGSHFSFEYNTAFGQVNRINRYAPDQHLLNYISYNMDSSAGQTDCPRFTQRKHWADDWNGEAEAVTSYSVASDNSWSQQTAPDGTIFKEFYYTSGWQTGLTSSTEIWVNSVKQKWTDTTWTQDNTNLTYQKGPRVTETNVYDPSNRRRLTIGYATVTLPSGASCSLPNDVTEYQADATTVYRRTHTDYVTSSTYLNQQIIGLPDTVLLYDHNNVKFSETHYTYDWASHLEAMPGSVNPVQHDASYNTGFTTRGNLVMVTRSSVEPNPPPGIEFKYGYNVAGSVTFTRDMLWHQTFLSYGDSFSDGGNSRNTFAYPTTISDSDWNPTYMQYDFDFGATTRFKGRPAAGQTQGAIQTIAYDGAGRLARSTMTDSGAYTEWVYADTMKAVVQKSMILDSSLTDLAQRAVSTTVLDGGGHVVGRSSDLPSSTGGFSGQFIVYDNMGRAIQHTNPAEITSSWAPTGDDAAGWIWTYQTYDWRGRPRVTTNPDGSTRESSYGGCGCAGGEVVTARDERNRRTRTTKDVFGRLNKTEELNWDQTVASITNYTYNVRDQLSTMVQYDSVRSFSYDGYGRLASKTTPEQGTIGYSYFTDDSVQTLTDARAATTTFAYNSRKMVSGISFGVPAGGGQNVSWANVVGMTASGNNLTKTAAEAWGNAGAASNQTIASGDGYTEFTASGTNTNYLVGLSNGDSHQNYNDIDFAFHPANGGTLYIYEGGTSRGTFGSYATGDVLRVAIEGGVVKYRKNGTLLYTSTATPSYPLLVDTAAYTPGTTINNVVISSAGSGSGVAATPNVSFGYDAAGNRTSMTDGLGSVSYAYDKFSRLTSESRTFTGVGSYALSYQYNVGGELTSITNPSGSVVNYGYDRIGRLNNMTGSGAVSAASYVNSIAYRAFGPAKQVSYGNGRTLSLTYNNRMWVSKWDLPNSNGSSTSTTALGYEYDYNHYGESNTGRADFANSLYDGTLDRAWSHDHVGRLTSAYTGTEANANWGNPDGPYAQTYGYDVAGNMNSRAGWGGANPSYSASFNSHNQRSGLNYDASGNLTGNGSQTFSYDATGQQATASGHSSSFSYDGNRWRGKKVEDGATTYYLRSSVLGGQVVAELNGSGVWTRGYVYFGGELVALQQNSVVTWVHQEPLTKGQRLTNSSGNIVAMVEMDPWGGETNRSWISSSQPHKYTSYERDANQSDDAMNRRYDSSWGRFDQPDPYDGSYDLANPQSLNRYTYVQNDPVNFTDPSGLDGQPGDLCPGGVIGNDGVCYQGDVNVVNVYGGWDDDWLEDWTNGNPLDRWVITVAQPEVRPGASPLGPLGLGPGIGTIPGNPTSKTDAEKQRDYLECIRSVSARFTQGMNAIPNVFHNSLPSLKAVGGISLLVGLRAGGFAVVVGSISATAAAPLVISTFAMAYAGTWTVNVTNNFVDNALERGALFGDNIRGRIACRAWLQ